MTLSLASTLFSLCLSLFLWHLSRKNFTVKKSSKRGGGRAWWDAWMSSILFRLLSPFFPFLPAKILSFSVSGCPHPSPSCCIYTESAVGFGTAIKGPEDESLFAVPPTLCAVCLLADTTDFDPQWHTAVSWWVCSKQSQWGRGDKSSALGVWVIFLPVFSFFSIIL